MTESLRRTAGPEVKARSHGIRVEIQKHCLDKMHGWCNAAQSEVSGYGLVSLVDGVFKVRDVFFPEQKCSSGYTWIGSEALGRLIYSLHTRKKDIVDLRFWWHTHYNFNTFWSGTDDDQAQAIAHNNGEWSLSLVINQRGDRLCRTDFVKPVPIMVDNLTVVEVPNEGKVSKRNYDWDVKRWVTAWAPARVAYWKKDNTIVIKPKAPVEEETEKKMVLGGKLITVSQYKELLECFCGDMTCVSCSNILRQSEKTYHG